MYRNIALTYMYIYICINMMLEANIRDKHMCICTHIYVHTCIHVDLLCFGCHATCVTVHCRCLKSRPIGDAKTGIPNYVVGRWFAMGIFMSGLYYICHGQNFVEGDNLGGCVGSLFKGWFVLIWWRQLFSKYGCTS